MAIDRIGEITQEDEEAMKPVLQKLAIPSRQAVTIKYLLGKWELIVYFVESGYKMCSDDYTHDMYLRGYIEEVLAAAPDELRAKLESIVFPLDMRFENATCPVTKQIANRDNPQWWDFRIPKKSNPDFLRDLKYLGIIE